MKNLSNKLHYYLLILLYLTLITGSITYGEEPNSSVITLEDAISAALKNNPIIKISEAEIDIFKSRIRKAKSARYPHINSKLIIPFVGTESGFFLDQLIWDFGRTSSIIRARYLETSSKELERKNNIDNLIKDTKIAFYNALIAQELAKSYKKKTERAELTLTKIKELYKTGRASILDLTQAKSDLANTRLELANMKKAVESTRANLSGIMGRDIPQNAVLKDNANYSPFNYTLNEAINMAISNNNRLKGLNTLKSAIKAELKAKKREFFPIIFGRTAYRFKGEGTDEEGTDTPAFIAGIGIKIPLFTGFSRFAEIDASHARLRKSEAEIENLKNEIISHVKNFYAETKFSFEKIGVAKENLSLAEGNLKLVKEKHKLGRASILELVDAQFFYLESLAKYKEAIYSYKINKSHLERLIGRTKVQ